MTNALPTYKSIFLTVLFLVSYEVKTTELTLKMIFLLSIEMRSSKKSFIKKQKVRKFLATETRDEFFLVIFTLQKMATNTILSIPTVKKLLTPQTE